MSTIKHGNKEYKIKSPHEVIWDDQKDIQLVVLRKAEKPVEIIAKCFGYSESTIQSRLKILGMTNNPWTASQDRILRDNYKTHTRTELAKMVQINPNYVADRLEFLGLSK